MWLRGRLAVLASRAAGLGASTERLVNNGLDGARASATFGAATEAAIDLLGIARELLSGTDGVADIVVAEDVAGTNNHENAQALRWCFAMDIVRPRRDAKGKTVFSSDSKLVPDTDWNESKNFCCGRSKSRSFPLAEWH
jgi:hypothetical protein